MMVKSGILGVEWRANYAVVFSIPSPRVIINRGTHEFIYSEQELVAIGFKSLGANALISRNTCIYTPEKISIGDNVRIDDFSFLLGEITFGNQIHVAPYCLLMGAYGIVIEDFAGISSRTSIYSATDDFGGDVLTGPTIGDEYKNVTGGPVIIKKHVIIGATTVILPDLTLGEGVSVGAHSLVTKSLAPWGIYFGCPVKRIKDREQGLLELEKKFLASKS
jgi:acetyltransferase-like isoleucine patch superfamily enzyme